MIACVDTSVIARKLFGEPEPLAEWPRIREAYASRLLPVELGRVIDRCRLAGDIDDEDVDHLHAEARRVLRSVEIVDLSEDILARATGPMPTVLGTLDAIHLATALVVGRSLDAPPVFATHDRALARAARSSGLEVVGA